MNVSLGGAHPSIFLIFFKNSFKKALLDSTVPIIIGFKGLAVIQVMLRDPHMKMSYPTGFWFLASESRIKEGVIS